MFDKHSMMYKSTTGTMAIPFDSVIILRTSDFAHNLCHFMINDVAMGTIVVPYDSAT
jgi:hypothetical protein